MASSYLREPTIEFFGRALLASGDLDPLYIALVGAKLDTDHLKRFLFTYWCCYDAGASCFISEETGVGYWELMRQMATNFPPSPLGARWPRGHERRHFRGEKAVKAVQQLYHAHPQVEGLVDWIIYGHDGSIGTPSAAQPIPFHEIRRRVMMLPQFGPWIAFKVGDMAERVLSIPVRFNDADVFMFDSPREAALDTAKVWSENLRAGKPWNESDASETRLVRAVSETLIEQFKHRLAPPHYDRPVNIQEVETILCKYKSHLNGHYPLGYDTKEIREGLTAWSCVSKTAERLLASMPK